jgi:hypothetical protein
MPDNVVRLKYRGRNPQEQIDLVIPDDAPDHAGFTVARV